ncbi:hypothetical protein [Streptomyces millisiae]|uniref:LigA protein n=1 Tax=Streptomyces millisiae TaxID=3075542 RepID=A0ABU2M196_9ACTN|nr:hypothetical protein [Streptomyces sp. DSM 44918]MDT0323617.1 hypothetical protein [Streptomyces sp. DSM 44918]
MTKGTTVHYFHAEEPELRRAMEHAVGGLAPPVDLVPGALLLGRRRRARARLATAGGGVAVAALATVLGVGFVPPGDDAVVAEPPASTATEPGLPGPTVSTPVPTPNNAESHARAVDYRARVAALLDELLPGLGAVSATDYDIARYRAMTGSDAAYQITFSATPEVDANTGRCAASESAETCTELQLSDGTPAAVRTTPGGQSAAGLRVVFSYGGTEATVAVDADSGEEGALPVDVADLTAVAENQDARELLLEGAELAQAMAS